MCYTTKCYFFSLPSSAVLSYAEYKPMLIFFGLIDAVQRLLKVRMRERERREGKEKRERGEGRRELGKGREGGEHINTMLLFNRNRLGSVVVTCLRLH